MAHGVEGVVRLLVVLLALLVAPRASAQDAGASVAAEQDPEYEAFRRMVDADPFTDRSDDPIGRGDARDEEMRTMRLPEPEEIVEERIPPQSGAVLTAIPGVRERAHAIAIELREGLLIAREELELVSSARLPAEAQVRLAIPEGGALVALEVCAASGCRVGAPAAPSTTALSAYDDAARARGAREGLPIAHAVASRDERGAAIVVRAAPVVEGRAPLVVRVTWAVRAPVRGGRMRLVLPARGSDARAADARVTVRAIDLVAPAIDGIPAEHEETRAPSAALAISAAIPITGVLRGTALFAPCGDRARCVLARAVAARPRIESADVIVAIDASPSTVAGARGRIAPTVRALLSMLPTRSRVRVVAFAARAEEIGAGWRAPTSIEGAALDAAVERELGSATRFESLWDQVSPWAGRGTRIVIVGDGGWTESEAGREALAASQRAGVAIASVNVADRSSTAALARALAGADGLVIDAGPEADEHARGRASEPLTALLTAPLVDRAAREVMLGRRAAGALRAGEELAVLERVEGEPPPLRIDQRTVRPRPAGPELAPAIVALASPSPIALVAIDEGDRVRASAGSCAARGPYATNSAVVPREVGLALAHGRRCEPIAEVQLGGAPAARPSRLPPRALLRSLRSRVIPPARACFRADRRGRGAYQERAEIRIELADREIVQSDVRGEIQPALRACLLRALDNLDVPGFEGRVIVTWPLYTAPSMPPPVLELAPEVADEVDRAIPREEP